ncbi:MAG: hypothetical protein PVH61_31030 [Candidatus Aminicenantes bacterium]
MKKLVLITAVFLLLVGLAVYGGGVYSEFKLLMDKVVLSLEKLTIGLEQAEDADDVVAALDSYTSDILPLAPKMKELIKKYPELKELKDENTCPEELRPVMKKIDKLGERMVGGFVKVQQYTNDPKVKAAQIRWLKAMAAMEALQGEEEKEQEEKNEGEKLRR